MSVRTKGKHRKSVRRSGTIRASVVSGESVYNRIASTCTKVEWPFKSVPAPSPKGRGEYEGAEVIFVSKEDWETLVDFLEDLRARERFERIKGEPPEAFIDLEELKRRALKNRIKEARRSKGVTQVALADRLGCKQSYVSKIERPDYRPRFETLKKVAEALGCGVEELI